MEDTAQVHCTGPSTPCITLFTTYISSTSDTVLLDQPVTLIEYRHCIPRNNNHAAPTPHPGLEEALKDQKTKDNILPKLMSSSSGNLDNLFNIEIKKYDGLKADVARNVSRNDELLAAIARDAQVWYGPGLRAGFLRMFCNVTASYLLQAPGKATSQLSG